MGDEMMTRYTTIKIDNYVTFFDYIDKHGGRVGGSEIYFTDKYIYVFKKNNELIKKLFMSKIYYGFNADIILKLLLKTNVTQNIRICRTPKIKENKKIFIKEKICNVL